MKALLPLSSLIIIVLCSTLIAAPTHAADTLPLLSVEAILGSLRETTTASETMPANPEADLRARLDHFQAEAHSLSDTVAAQRWIGLMKQYASLPPNTRNPEGGTAPLAIDAVWEVLPRPEAWPWMAMNWAPESSSEEGNQERPVRLIRSVLSGDHAGTWREIRAAADQVLALPQHERSMAQYAFTRLLDASIASFDSPDSIAEALDLRLRMLEARKNASAEFYESLAHPDLVTILGASRAESLIERALRLPFPLQIPMGAETRRLGIRLAMRADSSEIGAPQWFLAASSEGFDLCERMDALFPRQEQNWNRGPARAYYLLGLVERGRISEARSMASAFIGKEFSFYAPIEAFKRSGRSSFARTALHELLSANPGLNLWDMYAGLTNEYGRSEDLTDLAEVALQDSRSRPHRVEISRHLLSAHLERDRMSDARDIIEKVLAWSEAPPSESSSSEPGEDGNTASAELIAFATQAMAAGDLLADSVFVESALRIMRAALPATAGRPGNYLESYHRQTLIKALIDRGRFSEAQAEVIKSMRARSAAAQLLPPNAGSPPRDNSDAIALVSIFHHAGRWQEVLALFDTAALWRDTDVASVITEDLYGSEPLGYYLASALMKAGREDQALRVTNALLARKSSCDSAYELLLRLNPPDLIAKLDALAALDRFEERPLIWKAIVLLQRGELAAAEDAASAAISLDPTDGDQAPGHRILAYATMQSIKTARADSTGAALYGGIVESVRGAEEADRWRAAGLLSHAMTRYSAALESFADAYCIHARLAVQFARAGRSEEAAEHFKRSFELIPGQIGRMESFCFGCESVFSGELASSIADSVFTRLRGERPADPRAAYLLGYLREEQGRFEEAAKEYRAAVRLDTDYLSAWRRLSDLGSRIWIPRSDRREVALELARLDPSGNHATFDPNFIDDPTLAWNLAERRRMSSDPGTLVYPMRAASRPVAASQQFAFRPDLLSAMSGRPPSNPRTVVRSLPILQAISGWIDAERSRRGMRSHLIHALIY